MPNICENLNPLRNYSFHSFGNLVNPSGSPSVLLSGDVLAGEGVEVGWSRIWSSRHCVELVYVKVLIRRFKELTAL